MDSDNALAHVAFDVKQSLTTPSSQINLRTGLCWRRVLGTCSWDFALYWYLFVSAWYIFVSSWYIFVSSLVHICLMSVNWYIFVSLLVHIVSSWYIKRGTYTFLLVSFCLFALFVGTFLSVPGFFGLYFCLCV